MNVISKKWIVTGLVSLLAGIGVMAQKPVAVGTPTNLRASAVSSSQINLTWTDNADNETAYYVERSIGSGSTQFSVIATLPANSTSFANTSLSASTIYNYRVRAYNANGNKKAQWSDYSNTASATTPSTGYTISTSSSPTAGGSTSGGGTYTSGTTITVSASPSSCYNFVSWTENGVTVSTSANYSFTVNTNRTLVANFSQKTFTISTSSSPSAGGSTSGGGTKACGTMATVSASASSGYTFASWTESGVIVSTSSSYSFTVTANRSLVANFNSTSTNNFTISTSSSPTAGGSTSGGGVYASGTTVTVSASPSSCYNFVSWTENGTTVSTSPNYSFTVTGNRTLVANFSQKTFLITTTSSPTAGGSTSGGGTKSCGTTATVSASAASGYSFASWTENGVVVSTSASYSFVVTTSRSLVANFTSSTVSSGQWVMGFGGSVADMGQAVARDGSGNLIVAGYFSGTVNFGGGALTSAGGQDIFVAKYSPSGTHLWSRRFGGSGDDAAQSVAVDLNGDVVVAGYFSGSATIGSVGYTSKAGRDIFVLKLSGSSGSPLWSNQIGGDAWSTSTPDDYGYGVATDPRNGDVVLTGQISGWVYFDGNLVICAGPDTFLAKYTSGGVFQWAKTFGMAGTDYGKGVAVDGSGNIVLTGNTTGAIDLGGGLLPFSTSGGYLNFFVGKFTGAGAHLWSGCYGGIYGSFANGVAVDGSGNVLVTGHFSGTMSIGTISISGSGASQTAFVTKLSGSSGAGLWARSLTTTVMAAGNGVAADGSGNVVLSGYFQGSLTPAGGSTLNSAGGYDGFVVKYNGSGTHVWGRRMGGTSSDWGNAITTDGSGNVITAGATNGGDFSGQTLSSNGGFDVFLLKLAP